MIFRALMLVSGLAIGHAAALLAQEVATKTAPSIEAIDKSMQEYVDRGEISGAVTLVGHEGKIVHLGAVGLSDIEAQRPMKRFSRFSIASMTKPITATAVMILRDDRKLDIDDKLSQYIPEFSNVKLRDGAKPSRELTIRDAITHSSGLGGSQVFEGSLADHCRELATRPLAFEPGTQWQYSPGMSVAGRIVEIVSGQPFQEFLQQRIFDPLGMTNTTFYPDAKQQRQLAKIYMPSEDKQSLVVAENFITDYQPSNGPNPSGGLVSTGRDLFRFYQMILNGGKLRNKRIVSAESVATMTSPQTGDLVTGFTPGNSWGLGWCVVREPQGVTGMLSPGTFGHGGAFGTQGWVDPKSNIIFVLLIQRTEMGNSDGAAIRGTFQQAAVDALRL